MALYADADNYPWNEEQQRKLKKRRRKKRNRSPPTPNPTPNPTPFPTPNPTSPLAGALGGFLTGVGIPVGNFGNLGDFGQQGDQDATGGVVPEFLGILASIEQVEEMTSQEKLEMCINLYKRIQEDRARSGSGKGKGKSKQQKPTNLDPGVLAINMVRKLWEALYMYLQSCCTMSKLSSRRKG